jgi:hypothetical protein
MATSWARSPRRASRNVGTTVSPFSSHDFEGVVGRRNRCSRGQNLIPCRHGVTSKTTVGSGRLFDEIPGRLRRFHARFGRDVSGDFHKF